MIYRFLKKHLPPPLPEMVMAIWYSVLCLVVLLCAAIPNAPFRYLGL